MHSIDRCVKPLGALAFFLILIAMSATAEGQQRRILYFPQFGNGGGFASDLVIYNPSARTAVSGQVLFWDQDGRPLQLSMTARAGGGSSVEGAGFVLEPRGSVTFMGTPEGSPVLGSAAVSADGLISGVVRFHLPGIGIAGVESAEPALALIAPVRRQGVIDTGVAVRNVHTSPVDVTLTLRDEAGVPVSGGIRVLSALQPNARVAGFIEQLFPDAQTSGFGGTLSIRPSEGKLAAVALELGSSPGEFTTLPVSPLDAPSTDFGDLSGTWSGTTAQGLPVSFTVADGVITSFEGRIALEGMGCNRNSGFLTQVPAPVFDNAFTINSCFSFFFITASDRIKGAFTSSSTAEGTWTSFSSGSLLPGACDLEAETSWSAVRQ